MSAYSHFLQIMYLGVPALSALAFLVLLVALVYSGSNLRYGLNWLGWLLIVLSASLLLANIWIFWSVYGVYAARSVLG